VNVLRAWRTRKKVWSIDALLRKVVRVFVRGMRCYTSSYVYGEGGSWVEGGRRYELRGGSRDSHLQGAVFMYLERGGGPSRARVNLSQSTGA